MRLYLNNEHFIDTSEGIDISIPLSAATDSVRAWYCDPVKIEPVVNGNFIGDVNQGGSVNFRNVFLNPHGNGTHTECVGHISKENFSLNQCLKEFHFFALLLTISPKRINNKQFNEEDLIIDADSIREVLATLGSTASFSSIIIRTPGTKKEKWHRNYSNQNPPYLTVDAIDYILNLGVDHLVIDLPSIDRENDHGKLLAHHRFWNYPENPQLRRTITEMVCVPEEINDGIYLLNIQITSLENDASPSKLMLYKIV